MLENMLDLPSATLRPQPLNPKPDLLACAAALVSSAQTRLQPAIRQGLNSMLHLCLSVATGVSVDTALRSAVHS